MSKQRKFTDEFKRETVCLTDEPGVTCSQIGHDLGINPTMLAGWRREMASDGQRALQGHGQSRNEDRMVV